MSTGGTDGPAAAVTAAAAAADADGSAERAAPGGPAFRREFIVQREGRSFSLYAGLLDYAHQLGLTGISTNLVQVPSELNGMVAIAHATVTLQDERGERVFQGLGDANPTNVTRMMAPHLIRMAETRAKARALRDAVNIGTAALEELGGEGTEEGHDGQQKPEEGVSAAWPGAAPRAVKQDPNSPATPEQLNALQNLARAARITVKTEGLTFDQAAQQIAQLQSTRRGGS